MPIIICPGIHPPELTNCFVEAIQNRIDREYLILPTSEYLPYSPFSVDRWLNQQQLDPTKPLTFIAFSAGVVGGFGAATKWQLQGGKINNFIAFDGWGIPLLANFPIYRVSHDYFTHWSSGILEARHLDFYADPEVEHLAIWRSPQTCAGWQILSTGFKTRCMAINYLENILNPT